MNGRSCSSSAVSDRGMESDSVFHNFLVCIELLPVLQAVLAIPNMNALPVHCANQVLRVSLGIQLTIVVGPLSELAFACHRACSFPSGACSRIKHICSL